MNRDNLIGLPAHKSQTIPVVLLDVQHTGSGDLHAVLDEIPQIEIVAETTSVSLSSHLLNRHLPQLVFLAIEEAQESLFELLTQIREAHSHLKIILVSASTDTDLILRSFRAGIDEFLPRPLNKEEVLDVLKRVQRTAPVPEPQISLGSGMVIALWGSRGGCGTTTLACNLAQQLSLTHPVVLVDFHLAQGELSVYLDAKPTYTLHDILENRDRLDEALVDSILLKYSDRLHLLLQPMEYQPLEFQNGDIEALMAILRRRYAFVVLDMGHEPQFILDIAPHIQQILLVINQNLPSICLASRKSKLWQRWDHPKEVLRPLVNAYDRKNPVTLAQIGKSLDTNPKEFFCVRHDEARVLSAINQGIPLQDVSTWGKAYKDIATLAKQLIHEKEVQSKNPPPSGTSSALPPTRFYKQAMI